MGSGESSRRNKHEHSEVNINLFLIPCCNGSVAPHPPDFLIHKFTRDNYEPYPDTTYRYDPTDKGVMIDDHKCYIYTTVMDDTSYISMNDAFDPRCKGIMVLYSIRDLESFENAKELIAEKHMEVDGEVTPLILVGAQYTKTEVRQVEYHTARQFADERGIPLVETYGEEGINVELAFMTLVGEALAKYEMQETTRRKKKKYYLY